MCCFVILLFSPTAASFGVSAQIGSGVVQGGPEVRFHEGSTRVPPGSHEGPTRFCEGCGVVRALRKEHRMLLGISPELIVFFLGGEGNYFARFGLEEEAEKLWQEADLRTHRKCWRSASSNQSIPGPLNLFLVLWARLSNETGPFCYQGHWAIGS